MNQPSITLPEKHLPIACDDSPFFPIADQLLKFEQQSPQGLYPLISGKKPTSHPVFSSANDYLHFQGAHKKTETAKILELTLNLSPFLKSDNQIKPPTIFVVSSAAHHNINIGRFIVNENNNVVFQLPRFSIEPTVQIDMSTAVHQAFHIPEISQRILENLQNLTQEAFITYLTREGHLTNIHSAIFNILKQQISYTIATIQHLNKGDCPDQNIQFHRIFKRISLITPVNFSEGLNPFKIKTAIFGDQGASGMQFVDIADYLIKHVAKINKDHNLNHLVFVSPLLSTFCAFAVSLYAAKNGFKTTFVTSGSLLNSGPEKYYSPLSSNKKVCPLPLMQKIHHLAHPENVRYKLCVSCNWTARFGASPETALQHSQEELDNFGITNEELIEHAAQQTPAILHLLKKNNLPRTTLIPESSLVLAQQNNQLPILEKFIASNTIS